MARNGIGSEVLNNKMVRDGKVTIPYHFNQLNLFLGFFLLRARINVCVCVCACACVCVCVCFLLFYFFLQNSENLDNKMVRDGKDW